ncbi:LPS assembly protein LptD [Cognatishimia sp. SS12]|uniref:LPS-assembly protein LptD n=1 Tax=Cognatishimia sp. SS12 TaxID=2979465 RepID=UPI002330603F|nr:LPS assembly protein LptD [Cognatishimia sp. SS12]MDC0737306.1 LPS assembly protein LptD [Cognatishimia sp. SS12]
MRINSLTPRLAAATLSAVLLLSAPMVMAQQRPADENVILLADSVYLRGNNTLEARGNIEATRGETKLTASAIIYDSQADTITVEGPITIVDGDTVEVFAEFAELDTALQNGLLKSARLVLRQQVTIQAAEAERIAGKKSVLYSATATSCITCGDEAPLWQVRARKVTHDEEARQLYFDDAQFRVMDVPIFYLPRLRFPDPTQTRATGFLFPEIKSRSRLATGVKIPYFIAIGDHKDLTLTPYISPNTLTMEWRYRQAFRNGGLTFEGALSRDDFSTQGNRAYVFGNGAFELARDYTLSFDLKAVSDDAYLADYDYSGLDRLTSEVALTRVNRDENTKLALLHYESLRASESNLTLPAIVLSARKQKRFYPNALGGEALWELEAHAHHRRSDVATDANGDGVIDGRDVARLNANLEWRDTWLTQGGLEYGVTAAVALDAARTTQDSNLSDESYLQITPTVAAHLRYPLIRQTNAGATQILEPIAQIAWSGGGLRLGSDLANDESTRVEFDEGNLLALSRFPSDDRRERGLVGAWGLNWSRLGPGWDAHLTVGQVVRAEAHPDFSTSSGLASQASDFLIATKLNAENGLFFTTRTLVDGIEGLGKVEARGGWDSDKLDVSASYVWLDSDPAEDRATDLSEWNFDGAYRVNRHWTGLANWRFDVASRETAEAGIGFEYRNECVKARFSVSRRFTSSTTVLPATDLSFTVEILGFSANSVDKSYARKCEETAG